MPRSADTSPLSKRTPARYTVCAALNWGGAHMRPIRFLRRVRQVLIEAAETFLLAVLLYQIIARSFQ
jgi:hypothetical protein